MGFQCCILNLIRFLCHKPQLRKLADELHQHQIHKTHSLLAGTHRNTLGRLAADSASFRFGHSRSLFMIGGRQTN